MNAKLPIDRPCSACSGGDYEMKYHDHAPPFRAEAAQSPEPLNLCTPHRQWFDGRIKYAHMDCVICEFLSFKMQFGRVGESPEPRCSSCGYTKQDAQINGDHHRCNLAGKAPWEVGSVGESPAPAKKTFNAEIKRILNDLRAGESPAPAKEFPFCPKCGEKVTIDWEIHEEECQAEQVVATPQDLNRIDATTGVPKATSDSLLDESFEALTKYLQLHNDIADIESGECSCEDFHTCRLCRESQEKGAEQRRLMSLYGDSWATALQSRIPERVAAPPATGPGNCADYPDWHTHHMHQALSHTSEWKPV